MPNKDLFSTKHRNVPEADKVNRAGGAAYSMSDKAALAQLAVTGTFNNMYYATGQQQLEEVRNLLANIHDAEYIAKLAVYARKNGGMKDMPAFLLAHLSTTKEGRKYFESTFREVVNNGRMLRNFVQFIRSGAVGRTSFGSMPKRAINNYLHNRPDWLLFNDTVGNDPSIADIIRMTHPKPVDKTEEAFFGYIIGWIEYDADNDDFVYTYPEARKGERVSTEVMTDNVVAYERLKAGVTNEIPRLDFRKLDQLDLTSEQWKTVAQNQGWFALRLNLNNFARKGVFDSDYVVQELAEKLRNPDNVRRFNVFPYQLYTTYVHTRNNDDIPFEIKDALQDAVEVATENVPQLPGKTVIIVDVSGSMGSSITGYRRGATSVVTCMEVAALIGVSLLRTNKDAILLPVDTVVHNHNLNPRDTVITNAEKLAKYRGGGTNLAAGIEHLIKNNKPVDNIVMVSDNQSWYKNRSWRGRGTEMMRKYTELKRRNKNLRMVCIDIQSYTDTQAPDSEDIMNIGGFSDSVFDLLPTFFEGKLTDDTYWVNEIESVEL